MDLSQWILCFFPEAFIALPSPPDMLQQHELETIDNPLTHTHTHVCESWISRFEDTRLFRAVMILWWMDWAGHSTSRLDHFLEQNTLSLCKTPLTVWKWKNNEIVLVNSLIWKTRRRPLVDLIIAKDILHIQSRYCCYYILALIRIPEPLSLPHPPSTVHFRIHSFTITPLVRGLVFFTQNGLWMNEWSHYYYSSSALRSDSLSMFYGCQGVCRVIGFLISWAAAASQTSLSLHLKPSRGMISTFINLFSGGVPTSGLEKAFHIGLQSWLMPRNTHVLLLIFSLMRWIQSLLLPRYCPAVKSVT